MKILFVSPTRLSLVCSIILLTGCQPDGSDSQVVDNPASQSSGNQSGEISPTSEMQTKPEIKELEAPQPQPDQNTPAKPYFANSVIEQYFKDKTGFSNLQPEYLKNFSVLELPKKGVESLAGLEAIENLQKLDITQNQISDLSPLQGLDKLTELSATFNQIKDIAPLANKPNLKILHLGDNPIQSLNPLKNHPALEHVSLIDTPVKEASPLTTIPTIKHLDLDYTKVASLQNFNNLTNLEELRLNQTEISDISPLAGLTSLKKLHIQGTYVPQDQIANLKETHPDLEIYHDEVTRLPNQPPASP